ncbi:MAG TPA: SPOR domain-containing protein [Candidatus Angelobacter sp.]|jgi:cell division septation protein DedD|nr:SPOR domain-containing protein [Candidatus Angelobacter sp.]
MGETRELQGDAEITLGTGKLLGIFFGLAVICAVFFTMGYMLGRGSAAGAKTEIVSSVPNGNGAANKPSAGNNSNNKGPDASTQNCPAGSTNCPPTGSGPDSTFYDKNTTGQPVTGNSQPQGGNSSPQTSSSSASATTPEIKNVSTGSYIVQVVAVSKQEDAEFLVAALRKKQYPVFLSSGGGDALFRVQVGPFTDAKEAEAMRARLAGEGYNPIVKK